MNVFWYDNFGNVYPTHYEAQVAAHPTYWYWYDKEIAREPWKVEPLETLETLYKRRAEHLRDTFDYLILAYSGGVDSTKVLETFVYNGIVLDEILMVGAFSQDSATGVDENHNGELYHNAFHTLQTMPLPATTVTTTIDYTEYFKDPKSLPIIAGCGTEWYKKIGYYISVHHMFWNALPTLAPRKGRRVGVIFGQEKLPDLRFDPLPHVIFSDWNYVDYGCLPYDGSYCRVNFYTAPDSIDIVRKQAHILLKATRAGVVNPDHRVRVVQGNLKHPLNFVSKKSTTNILSVRDHFLLKKKDSQIYDIYSEGIKKYHVDYHKHNGSLAEMRPCHTRKYYLE